MTTLVVHPTCPGFTREVDAATLREQDVIYYRPLGVGEVRKIHGTLSLVMKLSNEVYFTVPSSGTIRYTRYLAKPGECTAVLDKLSECNRLSVVHCTSQKSSLTEARQLLDQGDIEKVTEAVIKLRDDDSRPAQDLCTLALDRLLSEVSIVLNADKAELAQRVGMLELAQTHRLI